MDSFFIAASIKNALHQKHESFCLQGEERMFYGLVVHQYPRGGGFMSGHRHLIGDDEGYTGSGLSRRYTVGLVMSKMGNEFTTGGGWATGKEVRVSWEHAAEPGDLIIYDEGIDHGCNTVDIFAPLDLGTLNGRLFGLVGIFVPEMRFKGGEEVATANHMGVVETVDGDVPVAVETWRRLG